MGLLFPQSNPNWGSSKVLPNFLHPSILFVRNWLEEEKSYSMSKGGDFEPLGALLDLKLKD